MVQGGEQQYGIEAFYNVCANMPSLGLVNCFLPNLQRTIRK